MVEEEIYNGQRSERARQRAQCKKVPKRNKYGKLFESPNGQALTLAYTVYKICWICEDGQMPEQNYARLEVTRLMKKVSDSTVV